MLRMGVKLLTVINFTISEALLQTSVVTPPDVIRHDGDITYCSLEKYIFIESSRMKFKGVQSG